MPEKLRMKHRGRNYHGRNNNGERNTKDGQDWVNNQPFYAQNFGNQAPNQFGQ
jgi:hypothetical protein